MPVENKIKIYSQKKTEEVIKLQKQKNIRFLLKLPDMIPQHLVKMRWINNDKIITLNRNLKAFYYSWTL